MPDTLGAASGSSVSICTVPVIDHNPTEWDLLKKKRQLVNPKDTCQIIGIAKVPHPQ